MAFYDTTWYCNFGNGTSTGYYAVTVRPQNTAVAAGVIRRQFTAPVVGSERCFVCIVAGTTANVTDATWVLTRGAKTVDGTATWQECTGASAVNGDLTNTANWTQAKAIGAPTLGAIIQRNNGASYQICTTAGTMGASEPAFSNTAGVTTTETAGTAVWTSLGPVGNFTGGQAPHARLANACASTWFAVGNTVYVGANHAESQATAITIAPAVSATTIGKIICHNQSGSYPPASGDLTTGATVSTTAAVNLTFNPSNGAVYVYGIAFQAGVGVSSGVSNIILTPINAYYFFDNCIFKIANTSASVSTIQLNTTSAGVVLWNNCTVGFGATGQFIDIGVVTFVWQNTGQVLVAGSTVPTVLLGASANARLSSVVLEALDLSQITATLTGAVGVVAMSNWLIKDCKFNASTAILTPQNFGQTIQLVRCDSGATGYKSARYQYEGTETTETSITRVGGAVDPTGQAQSRKIITTANVQWLRPFKAEPYAILNAITGANVTVTVYGTVNAGVLPMNDDIWMEVEYLGSASQPLGSIVTTTKANLLASNASVASDSSTWNNTAPAFDPATTTNTNLSNGNLTATHSNTTSNSGARSLPAVLSSGKFYFEITVVAGHGTFDAMGLMSPGGAYADLLGSSTTVTVGRGGGNITANNNVSGLTIGAFAANDVCGIAVDFNALLIWFRRNAGNWNNSGIANPATGIGGVAINAGTYTPAVAFIGTGTAVNDAYTANFGATSYANAAPSGFGNVIASLPFKLVATLSSPQPGLAGFLEARVRAAKASATYYIDPRPVLS